MKDPAPAASAAYPRPNSRLVWLAAGLILLAALAAYHNSFRGAFLLDDRGSITENATIRRLGDFGQILATPGQGATAQGRPVLNLSLALNYAAGGLAARGYHWTNWVIHALAGLTLLGIVRRTLLLPGFGDRYRRDALWIALAVAGLWTVHPLQTESVTYLIQRAESLMGLFYLLTLYCFVRSADPSSSDGSCSGTPQAFRVPTANGPRKPRRLLLPKHSIRWDWLGILFCLLGMGTKEVMVSAPVLLWLYDRTFVAGSFAEAWRRRRGLYLALAATWVWLAVLVISTGGNRGGSVGFGVHVPAWAYALTQFEAIGRYLCLTLWPAPLIFEYGPLRAEPASLTLWAPLVLALLIGTVVALRRAPAVGFLGCWFFAILAPTSLLPGTTQMIVEHRMYLSLAAVLALLVVGCYTYLGRTSFWVWAVAGAALVGLTARRNEDYRSAVALWTDTVRKRPANPNAHYNLGYVLAEQPGRQSEAVAEYRTALQLNSRFWEAQLGIGNVLSTLPGRLAEAIAAYRAALAINPAYAEGYDDLGNALANVPGGLPEAIEAYRTALRLDPTSATAHYNLGVTLAALPDRQAEAEAQLRAALKLTPDNAQAHNNLGMVLAAAPDRMPEAMAEYRLALKFNPGDAEAHNNLGNALAGQNRPAEAVAEFEAALRANPALAQVHYNLGAVLLDLPGHGADAEAHLREALRLEPDLEAARRLLAQLGAMPSAR